VDLVYSVFVCNYNTFPELSIFFSSITNAFRFMKELSQRQTSLNFSRWFDSRVEKLKCSHINMWQGAIDIYVWVMH